MKSGKTFYWGFLCIPYQPFVLLNRWFSPFLSLYLPTSVRLFIHTERLTAELRSYLNASCDGPLCVQLKNYTTVRNHLQDYVARSGIKVWIGTEYTNYALYELITPVVR